MLKPKTTMNEPNHFPRMKPANNATGDPNPKNGKTHNIVKKKNRDNKKCFLFLFLKIFNIIFYKFIR